jgi:hypothetical protein
MKSAFTIAKVFLLPVLGGCATGSWSPPDAADANVKEDRLECEQQANQLYPVVIVNIDVNAGPRANALAACLRAKGYVFNPGQARNSGVEPAHP